jgi:hypothetical protein
MTFNLDFALFYAYTLALFAFALLWLTTQLVHAVNQHLRAMRAARHLAAQRKIQPERPRTVTRLEAFTRL